MEHLKTTIIPRRVLAKAIYAWNLLFYLSVARFLNCPSCTAIWGLFKPKKLCVCTLKLGLEYLT